MADNFEIFQIELLPYYIINNGVAELVPIPNLKSGDSTFKNVKLLTDNNDEFDDEDPIRQKELGDWGERLAENYLKAHYKDVKNVTKQIRRGYDFCVTINNREYGYEIKTSESMYIIITYPELSKAQEMEYDYNIFFIHTNKDKSCAKGYIINNPVKTLGIDFRTLPYKIEIQSDNTMICYRFKIKLAKNFLKNHEILDFNLDDLL